MCAALKVSDDDDGLDLLLRLRGISPLALPSETWGQGYNSPMDGELPTFVSALSQGRRGYRKQDRGWNVERGRRGRISPINKRITHDSVTAGELGRQIGLSAD